MEPTKPEVLSEQVSVQSEGIVSRSLLKRAGGNITLFAFSSGQGLSEHSTPFDAAVLLLEGSLIIRVGGEDFEVEPGHFLPLPANVPHAVTAKSDSKMLLVMLKN